GYISQPNLDAVLRVFNKRFCFGQLLVREKAIQEADLVAALQEQERKNNTKKLGEILVERELITEPILNRLLSRHLGIPFLSLKELTIDESMAKLDVSMQYMARNNLVPFSFQDDVLIVAMSDPTNKELINDLRGSTGCTIQPVLSNRDDIKLSISRLFGSSYEDTIRLSFMDKQRKGSRYIEEISPIAEKIVNAVLLKAVQRKSSDIHIEPGELFPVVRLRIDGILQEVRLAGLEEQFKISVKSVISKIKIMADLDIAEKRRPQDGRFSIGLNEGERVRSIDFRVSITPTYFGESVVMRMLDQSKAPSSIYKMGFRLDTLNKIEETIHRPAGMILLTGPTGSGKTSTLFGMIKTIHTPDIKILTVEDPVEFVYPGIMQCEVNTSVNNTFVTYLRAFLRQDPDVIMLGEIRDAETAEIAFKAVQTGHLVLSTLHTTNATGVVSRLRHMGVEPNIISTGLLAVLAQRLVRMICPICKEEYTPDPEQIRGYERILPKTTRYYRGRGCSACSHTGYRGRRPVTELWAPSNDERWLLNKEASDVEIRARALGNGTVPLVKDGLMMVHEGITTIDEIIRVLPYEEIGGEDVQPGGQNIADFMEA
ncbi:MAG: Flp pilus assembly complex ATPase component TadA, partial [Deltaproteobacteria bacterium]|nr:Flp pilus assembly complex ATPase component TadA [Deltaproteobacteria bacterium]